MFPTNFVRRVSCLLWAISKENTFCVNISLIYRAFYKTQNPGYGTLLNISTCAVSRNSLKFCKNITPTANFLNDCWLHGCTFFYLTVVASNINYKCWFKLLSKIYILFNQLTFLLTRFFKSTQGVVPGLKGLFLFLFSIYIL